MNIENKIITTIENAKQNVVKITTSKKGSVKDFGDLNF